MAEDSSRDFFSIYPIQSYPSTVQCGQVDNTEIKPFAHMSNVESPVNPLTGCLWEEAGVLGTPADTRTCKLHAEQPCPDGGFKPPRGVQKKPNE